MWDRGFWLGLFLAILSASMYFFGRSAWAEDKCSRAVLTRARAERTILLRRIPTLVALLERSSRGFKFATREVNNINAKLRKNDNTFRKCSESQSSDNPSFTGNEPNLLSNGGFETELLEWRSSKRSSTASSQLKAYSGNSSLEIKAKPTQINAIYQDVSLDDTESTQAFVSVWSSEANSTASLRTIRWYRGRELLRVDVLKPEKDSTEDGWTQFTGLFNIPRGAQKARFHIFTSQGPRTVLYFDSAEFFLATMTPPESTPEPIIDGTATPTGSPSPGVTPSITPSATPTRTPTPMGGSSNTLPGVPDPSFVASGNEVAIDPRSYVAPTFSASNTLHYYINNAVACNNNSNSGRGTVQTPICDPPDFDSGDIEPGSLLAFGGGTYQIPSSSRIANGTASNPVVIRGVSPSSKPIFITDHLGNDAAISNIVLENFKLDCDGEAGIRITGASNLALRGIEISNCNTPIQMVEADHILVLNSIIHDSVLNGRVWNDPDTDFDPDSNGLQIAHGSNSIWVIGNELYHIAGNGVYFGGQAGNPCDANSETHHIYVVDNNVHDVRQVGIGFKRVTDAFVIRNYVHDMNNPIRVQEDGSGILFQYAPERVWIMFNHIERTDGGIQVESDSCGGSNGSHGHIVGNLIHNIHSLNFDPNNANHHAAITIRGHDDLHIVNNTIYDIDTGLNIYDLNNQYIANNLIANVGVGYHIYFSGNSENTSVLNNLFAGSLKLRNGNSTTTSVPNFFNASGINLVSSGNQNAAAGFVDAAGGNFQLSASSAGVNMGILAPLYQRFLDGTGLAGFSGYGIDIRVDAAGQSRPLGTGWDVGAYESSF